MNKNNGKYKLYLHVILCFSYLELQIFFIDIAIYIYMILTCF